MINKDTKLLNSDSNLVFSFIFKNVLLVIKDCLIIGLFIQENSAGRCRCVQLLFGSLGRVRPARLSNK